MVAIIGNMTSSLPTWDGAQDRAHLGAEDFGPIEPDANAAFAEEGIIFPRNRQVGQGLVATDIEGAENDGDVRPDGLARSRGNWRPVHPR